MRWRKENENGKRGREGIEYGWKFGDERTGEKTGEMRRKSMLEVKEGV